MKQRNEVNLFAINNAKAKFQAPDESVRYKAEASLDFDAYVASLQSKDKIIDDTIENVQAAQNLGITSIHCQNKNIHNATNQLIEILHG